MLGPELIDQDLWADVGLNWWKYEVSYRWTGNGVMLTELGSGSSNLVKLNFLTIGRKYRISITGTKVGDPFYISGLTDLIIFTANGTLTVNQVASSSEFALKSQLGTGTVTALSVKEILEPTPTFAFIFDDGHSSDELVYSIFAEYGYKPSFAPTTLSLVLQADKDRYIAHAANGVSILAHSVNHPLMNDSGTIDYTTVESEMTVSKVFFEGLGIAIKGWVTPASALHADFFPIVNDNFEYGFTSLNAGGFTQAVDPLKMDRYGIESAMQNHNAATIQARVDTAIANNQLLVFYGHKIPSVYLNGDTTPFVSEAELRGLLTYIKTKTDAGICKVLTADAAIVDYYKAPFA
jgi:hypothetical protein